MNELSKCGCGDTAIVITVGDASHVKCLQCGIMTVGSSFQKASESWNTAMGLNTRSNEIGPKGNSTDLLTIRPLEVKQETNRVINQDGKVAVIISPYYGSGWSIGKKSQSILMFNKHLVKDVLDKNRNWSPDSLVVLKDALPGVLEGGGYTSPQDLKVRWISKGEPFIIESVDGAESIKLLSNLEILKA
jgi:hypothetical protein